MPAVLILRKKEYRVKHGITISEAIMELGLLPDSYLAVKNGEMVEETEILGDGDQVILVPVISGGVDLQ
jgi:sulfur carrier protein ThiS